MTIKQSWELVNRYNSLNIVTVTIPQITEIFKHIFVYRIDNDVTSSIIRAREDIRYVVYT